MAAIRHVSGESPVDDMIEVVEEDGVLIVDDFVGRSWLRDFNAAVQPFIDSHTPRYFGVEDGDDFLGRQTVRLTGVFAKVPSYVDLLLDERLLGMVDHFLGPNCGQYQLSSSEVIEIRGGETAQALHIDDVLWPAAYWLPQRLLGFTVLVAATDFTAENGATRVVPGSHRWQHADRVAQEHEVAQAVMPAGSAVFISGKTLHGGGANTNGGIRRAVAAGFTLGWLRTQENHQLHATVEEVARLPERARQLLGYELYLHHAEDATGGPLGYYEQGSPSVLFEGG